MVTISKFTRQSRGRTDNTMGNSSSEKGMKLDLGGVAKDDALDKAAKILQANGISSALINAGGDIASSGFMVLGLKKSMAILQQFPGVEAIFITIDGRTVVTPGLKDKVELTNSWHISKYQ